jgi:hypothetical protein
MLLYDLLANAPEVFRSIYGKKHSGENVGFVVGSGIDKAPAAPAVREPTRSSD